MKKQSRTRKCKWMKLDREACTTLHWSLHCTAPAISLTSDIWLTFFSQKSVFWQEKLKLHVSSLLHLTFFSIFFSCENQQKRSRARFDYGICILLQFPIYFPRESIFFVNVSISQFFWRCHLRLATKTFYKKNYVEVEGRCVINTTRRTKSKFRWKLFEIRAVEISTYNIK